MSLFNQDAPDFEAAPVETSRARKITSSILFAIFVVLALAAFFLPTPYVIARPGPVFNVLGKVDSQPVISIRGAATYSTSGALNLMTVSEVGKPGRTPSWIEVFRAWIDPAQTLIPVDVAYPPQVSVDQVETQNSSLMTDSRQDASVVALKKLGYQVPTQMKVGLVEAKTPADGVLKVDDLILFIDSKPATGFAQLTAAVKATEGKKPITLGIERAGKAMTVSMTPALLKKQVRIGIFVGYNYTFPVDVIFNLPDVSGPSGGLMFALGIYDELTPGELTAGHSISGTGQIDPSGQVGPIGGIQQKLYAAVSAKSKWFLAPASNCNEVVGHIPAGLNVVKISTFDQALHAVQVIANNGNTAALASCNATN